MASLAALNPKGSQSVLLGQKITVVLPAYNAVSTLERTVAEIPMDVVDDIILTDDHSRDHTAELSRRLGLHTIRHDHNRGYGGNQKTCYASALARGADIVVMLHPDYQYSPKLVTAMASMIASGHYDVVLGSRILGKGALAGGMPLYKYVANRGLTAVENLLAGQKLSEYHTGYRAWSRKVLERLPGAGAALTTDVPDMLRAVLCQAVARRSFIVMMSAAIQLTGSPMPENRPCVITLSPSATTTWFS